MDNALDSGWLPLTPGQLDFWDEFLAHPGQPVSTVAHLTRIKGDLDEEAMLQAFQEVAAETDVMALRFATGPDGTPVQRVDPGQRPSPRLIDLRGDGDPQRRAEALIQRDLTRPLNLYGGRLGAMWLIRADDRLWLWYCRGHHIFLDGYAMALIERRVAQVYAHLACGEPEGRPFARLQDYLTEEAEYAASARQEEARDFWRKRMASAPLPARLRKGSEDYPACPHSATIDLGHLAAPLRDLAMREGLGWPDLMLAMIAQWLARNGTGPGLTGESVLWLPLMGRMGSISAQVPAMVLNIVPWHLPPDASIAGLADDLKTLRRHGRCRIERIASDAGLTAQERFFFSPLVNIMPFDPPKFPRCTSTREVLAAGPGDGFNITVTADARGANMALHLEADPALTSADRFGHHASGLPRFLQNALAAVPA